LPIRLDDDDRDAGWRRSPGGLVSALTPVLQQRGGVWVGWAGHTGAVAVPESYEGIALRAVPITALSSRSIQICSGGSLCVMNSRIFFAIKTPPMDCDNWTNDGSQSLTAKCDPVTTLASSLFSNLRRFV